MQLLADKAGEYSDLDDDFEPKAASVISADASGFANDITNSLHAVSLSDRRVNVSAGIEGFNPSPISESESGSGSSPSPSKPMQNLWADYDDSASSSAHNEENIGNLWEGGQPKRPTDWDKMICPVHKVKCSGTCEVLSKMKAAQRREEARKAEAERRPRHSGDRG